MSDTILVLDAASITTGYAVFTDGALIDAGKLKSSHENANERIMSIVQDALDLAHEYKVDRVVIEDTSGKVSKRHKGGGAGLAVYGKAIGWLAGALKMKGFDVVLVLENTWTADMGSKAKRQVSVAARYKGYKAADDPGMDTSDAIALGDWFIARQKSGQVVLQS